MPALRYISIFILISIFIFQSHFVSVVAIIESEVAVNSIEDLELGSQIIENIEPERIIIENKKIDIEADISSLIAAKVEYKQSESISSIEPAFIEYSFHGTRENIIPTEDNSVFEDFLKPKDEIFITGEKNKKIKLNRPTKKIKKVSGTRGTIGVNMITGTNISSPSGDIIDPAQIDIAPVSGLTQIKANEYNWKKNKNKKI